MPKPKGPVVLTVVAPHNTFDPRIEGVETITDTGTEVPAQLAPAITKLAAEYGVTLVRS